MNGDVNDDDSAAVISPMGRLKWFLFNNGKR